MNPAEKQHITENMIALIDDTTLNPIPHSPGPGLLAQLQASRLLHKADADQIQTLENSKGEFAAKQKFYEIMMSRNSYQLLIQSLHAVNQSDAAGTLEKLYNKAPAAAAEALPVGTKKPANPGFRCMLLVDDCEIDDIVEVLESQPAAKDLLQKDWPKLAKKLGFTTGNIDEFKMKVDRDQMSVDELLPRMLEEWQAKTGDAATLGSLYDILASLKWNTFAQKLEQRFS